MYNYNKKIAKEKYYKIIRNKYLILKLKLFYLV